VYDSCCRYGLILLMHKVIKLCVLATVDADYF
jgi:hypothetical protein